MRQNKILPRVALAALAGLAASPAAKSGVIPTGVPDISVSEIGAGQTASAATLQCAVAVAAPLAPSTRLGDFNGDGKADLMLARTDGATRLTGRTWQYYPMNGTTKLSGDGTPTLSTDLDEVLVGMGDLDGDGKTDILLRDSAAGTWMYYPMNGVTPKTLGQGEVDIISKLNWRVAGILDLDGDGKDDILLRHSQTCCCATRRRAGGSTT